MPPRTLCDLILHTDTSFSIWKHSARKGEMPFFKEKTLLLKLKYNEESCIMNSVAKAELQKSIWLSNKNEVP